MQCAASGDADAFACGLAHHDAVGHFQDFVKVFQTLLVLDLGDDLNVLATIFVEVLCVCVLCVCVVCVYVSVVFRSSRIRQAAIVRCDLKHPR